MKVSIDWLKQLIDLKVSTDEVIRLLPLRSIGTKEITKDFIELDMKGYNRSDLLSMRGVAVEIAAITESNITFDNLTDGLEEYRNLPSIEVKVENPELAPLYCIAKIEGLKVEKSPEEWVKKLTDSGMRSINNIADITNLVMLEYGQPLHSFDAQVVKNETLIVKTAKKDEEIVTLDNKTRKLLPSDLLITDSSKALGIAGVMGGKNSEISDTTSSILLEAAIFDPLALQKTSSRLNLSSEASKRFQHGLTEKRLFQALDAAIKYYQQLGGKLTALTIAGSYPSIEKHIRLTQFKINSLVGIEIDPVFIEESLKKLHFEVKKENEGVWLVTPPYFRLDIEMEEDLIEEVARIYGYEKIPAKPLPGELPEKVGQKLFEFIYDLKVALARLGLTEIQTYSFYSSAVLNNLEKHKDRLVKIANPMSVETEYMKDLLWPNLLEKTVENLKYRNDVAIFEIGKVYRLKDNTLPEERYRLAIALSNNTSEPILELNAIIEELTKSLNLTIDVNDDDDTSPLVHPTRHFQLVNTGKEIGEMLEVHPRIVNRFGSYKRVAVLEIEIEPFLL